MTEAAMSFSGTIRGLFVFLFAAVVSGENEWSVTYGSYQICALKGSTVEIRCTYTYPDSIGSIRTQLLERFWLVEKTNGENLPNIAKSSEHVRFQCTNSSCILSIPNLRKSDEAMYKFRFTTNHEIGKYTGLPGVSLSVTDPHVKVVVNPTGIRLTCDDNCYQAKQYSYIWLKNNLELEKETKKFLLLPFNSTDRYHCVIEEGNERFSSPAVYAPKDPLLSGVPLAEIVEGDSLTLNCSSDANPKAKYTLYSKHGDNNGENVRETHPVFNSIQVSDSGLYRCKAENELGISLSPYIRIDVKHRPKTCTVSVSPSGKPEEGKPVNLTCISDANPAAQYTWYKHNETLPVRSGQVYRIHTVSSEDTANYFCKSENRYGNCYSAHLFLDILYAPKLPSVSVNHGEIMEGSSVTLKCLSDANPAAKYSWYRENDIKTLSSEAKLIFNSIKSTASGQYYCKASNNIGEKTTRINIDVKYAPRSLSISVSPAGKTMEGSLVTLTCSCDANPAAIYLWYKQGQDSPKASGKNLIIKNIQQEHSGDYYCKVQNILGYQNSTVSLIVVAGPLKLAAIGTMAFISLIFIFLIFIFLLRKRRSAIPSPKPGERPNNIEQCQHNQSEMGEDVQYASLRFLRRQRDPIYANLKPDTTGRSKEEEDEEPDVEYATVKFATTNLGQRNEDPEPDDDTAALYSVIDKIRRPKPDS